MKIAFYDCHPFEKDAFENAPLHACHQIVFIDGRLNVLTAALAQGAPCVCAFTNDKLNAQVLAALYTGGTRLIALRCAGFNNVDLKAAGELGMRVVRVPEYSPYAIAEHVVAMVQTLNRQTHKAYNRVREGNFSLNGLVGFDLHGKTFGIIGVGKIGKVLAKIMRGFGCEVLLRDMSVDADFARQTGARYVELNELLEKSDVISLNVPLNANTRYSINEQTLGKMKKGVMLINTGRGALIDTKALIQALKTGHIGSAGLDVYEEEEHFFFQDLSGQIISDDTLARLLTFPNVLITSHQGFLTHEALNNIAQTTLENIGQFESGQTLTNEVRFTSV